MRIIGGLALLLLTTRLFAITAADYLPPDADPDPDVPTPEAVLGWEVGDWHVSHDKLVQYMKVLADSSPRISLKETGRTYEERPLLLLTVSSPQNLANIEALRREHLDGEGPLVVWLGYSVHGNEASGANAALLTAYYLASSRSAFVEELLEGAVVLIDPAINPDGLNRFASWANHNAGRIPVADPVTRQHLEHWPGGRTNHYWFDLNRDWLPLVHPESRARITEYHRWLPHVLTDHHEQGGHPGFFFQPGAPSRQNPLTPDENLELTRALADYHGEALDRAGQPYFTEEAYDDFYYGKGSTYPDINGGIGILFEQKAIRGQELRTSLGVETFRTAIANQFRTSQSTLEGSWALRERLKAYQSGFHAAMQKRAAKRDIAAWIVADDGDPGRAKAFLETLDLHQIEYAPLSENLRADGLEFTAGYAWVIPARQKQFGLLEGLMEQRTQFRDNTFYDVSAWTLPLAYNLPYTELSRLPDSGPAVPPPDVSFDREARAWALDWSQIEAPPLLQRLLDEGARVRAASRPFTARTAAGDVSFVAGTLVVAAGTQEPDKLERIRSLLEEHATRGIHISSVVGSMTPAGPDLGSRRFFPVEPIRPLTLAGKGLTAYDVGEQWHLLDQRLGLAATLVELPDFDRVDLGDYTHLLMADGDYKALEPGAADRIARWISAGGVLIAAGRAASWAEALCFEQQPEVCNATTSPPEARKPPASRAYGDFADDNARRVIGGAIVSSRLDLTHPLAFGYRRETLPLFRRGTVELLPSLNAYSTPVRYSDDPLMAGFIGEERLNAIRGQPAVIAEKQGRGLVVRFANTPLFRGFWRGSERLFVNALYFGQGVQPTNLPELLPASGQERPRH
jgi:hypothetical protein